MQIAELTERRDALRAELESCESNTQKYKVAGVSTLAATGVGVVGNVALHNKIQSASGDGRGGHNSSMGDNMPADTATKEEKDKSSCQLFIELEMDLPPICQEIINNKN